MTPTTAQADVGQALEWSGANLAGAEDIPTYGDIIIIHTKRGAIRPGMGLIRSGVRLRLDRAKDRGCFRFTEVETGKSCDWFAWSLNHVRWSYAG